MNMVTEDKDKANNEVKITEIRLSLDNIIEIIFKWLLGFIVVGILIGIGVGLIVFIGSLIF